MATYIVRRPLQITRTAGYTFDVVLNVPAQLAVDPMAVVRFAVFGEDKAKIVDKTTPDITILEQVITIPVPAADTKGKAGIYKWEASIAQNSQVIQLGKGEFLLNDSDLTD